MFIVFCVALLLVWSEESHVRFVQLCVQLADACRFGGLFLLFFPLVLYPSILTLRLPELLSEGHFLVSDAGGSSSRDFTHWFVLSTSQVCIVCYRGSEKCYFFPPIMRVTLSVILPLL